MNRNNANPKRRKRLLISFILILCMGMTTVGIYRVVTVMKERNQDAQKTVSHSDQLYINYVKHLNEGQYEKMYDMLDEGSKANISKTDFVERNQTIYTDIDAKDVNVSIKRVKELSKNEEVVYYTMSMETVAGKLEFEHQAGFLWEDGKGYCLCWNDGIIFPDLEETDHVAVSRNEAKRGSIFDRNGRMLAGWGTASSVGLVPGKMKGDNGKSVRRISELLGVGIEAIEGKLQASWVKEDSFVPLKTIKKVDELELLSENVDQAALENDRVQKELLEIAGVIITDIEVRTYPLKEKAAHITGYVQNITVEELKELGSKGYHSDSLIGKNGLEKTYEDVLRGKDGCEANIVTKEGEEKKTLAMTLKKDGEDVHLTIDAEVQETLYNRFVGDKSCSVAMNPMTGEVLALVSTPSYDPNAFVLGMTSEEWKGLSEDGAKPMWSRFTGTWCPGSSFKPVIAAMGLTTGILDPNEDFGDEGLSWQKDASWGGYYVTTLHAYKNAILKNALIYSDNIYFAKAALKIGAVTLTEQLGLLGFGEAVPFDLAMTKSQYANSGKVESEVQLADSGYGQGQVLLNPLHLAGIYTAFMNKGNMVAPYIRKEEGYVNGSMGKMKGNDADGEGEGSLGSEQERYWKTNVFTEESVNQVRDALVQVIENKNGTASTCRIKGLRLAGKTGTAEIKATKDNDEGTELGWFAVFTPEADAEDSILVVSMVEDVKDRGGSSYVVKKDKKVLQWWSAYRKFTKYQ